MSTSWQEFTSECKSRWSALARSLFLGRALWKSKYQEKCRQLEECERARREDASRMQARLEEADETKRRLEERVAELEAERASLISVEDLLGEAPRGAQYGAGLIALSVNLASELGGLRPSVKALAVVMRWLGADVAIPKYQTVRMWMQRISLYRMWSARNEAGGVWLTDHSMQLGKGKILVVARTRENRMVGDRTPLRHEDLEVLAVLPGESWKRENVAEAYQALAASCGLPRAILTDGAVELRDPVATLGEAGKVPLSLRDPKHLLANLLEAELTRDPKYQPFTQKVSATRSAVQQTELAQFVPVSSKPKARFMNLAPTLKWARAVLWHLAHPKSRSRQGVTEERMQDKLGWLLEFKSEVRGWGACQDLASECLAFLNQRGIFKGAARQLEKRVAKHASSPSSRRILAGFTDYLRECERQLGAKERLPISTEILESLFARFKQMEKQHSKSGFTSLILVIPALLKETTPDEVMESFARVKVADVQAWIKTHLPSTLAAQRQLMYREAKPKTKKTKSKTKPKKRKSATSNTTAA